MPQRKPNERIPSVEIQGEDSYVVISRMTVKEVRESRKASDEQGDMFELGLDSVARHIADWNWVDDAGKPLPLPSKNPEVMERAMDDQKIHLRTEMMERNQNSL